VFPMAADGGDDVMAPVTALSRKAALLSRNGHFARAAEKYAAAVAAAQSLQQPDCLIVTALQLDEVSMLYAHARLPETPLADTAKAFERIFCVLLPATMPALQRRKEAGTLLPGSCRPAEAAFYGEVHHANAAAKKDVHRLVPAPMVDAGARLGYESYVSAACFAAMWLLLPQFWNQADLRTMPFPIVPDDQFAAQHAFVLSALELVQQSRVLITACLRGEASLIDTCRKVVSSSVIMDALPSEWAQQLQSALQRVERSGVMQQRDIELGLASMQRKRDAEHATASAQAAACGLRHCALPNCGAREAHVSHFKLCAACGGAAYCCKAHQAADWPAHKAACKVARARKAAAAAQNGGASGA
jgi:hypothetical protein